MKFNRRLILSFDWLWFLALAAICVAGVLTIWSTTAGTGLSRYFVRQLIYLAIAAIAFLIVVYFDYHLFSDFISIVYVLSLAMLVVVLIIGESRHGNKSWLSFGNTAFQPSELVKVVAIIALAKYYSESERDELELNELLIGGLIVAIPAFLVVLQGDLGTAVTYVPIYLAMSYLGGLKSKYALIAGLAVLLAAPVGWMTLKDYQRGRIENVFKPSNDPRNLGYQAIQSKIAVGSGRFLGKGFKQGSQGQLGFLPARHTDFVFAVWAEERGFLGSAGLMLLFVFVCYRLLGTAKEAKDKVGTYVATGVLAVMLFHLIINIGMDLGLVPIAGIPLPLMSAGGSSLISSMIALGLCMNIRMRRYVN